MEAQVIVRENWLTQKPRKVAFAFTVFIGFTLLITSLGFLSSLWNMDQWMPLNRESFFEQHQIWRLWTALFVHADLGHLLSNSVLFIPLLYLLTAYFGMTLSLVSISLGGLINYFVVKTLPSQVSLLGISGVVYLLGAIWLTLVVLIDRRHSLRRRFAYALFISVVLFAPEAYKPEISYLSHFLGFIFGMLTAVVYYGLKRQQILAAEVKEYIMEPPELPPEIQTYS